MKMMTNANREPMTVTTWAHFISAATQRAHSVVSGNVVMVEQMD